MAEAAESLEVMAKRRKTAWDASKSAAGNARLVLPHLAAAYIQASKKLSDGDPSVRNIHKFRLKTKRFRYTLELFRPCCGPGLEPRLEALRCIQQGLGEISDCVMTRRLLPGRKGIRPRQLARFSKFLDSRIAEKTASLLHHLERSLRAPGQQRWWEDYLARFPSR